MKKKKPTPKKEKVRKFKAIRMKKQRGWRRRAKEYALRQLAELDGTTIDVARKRYRKAKFDFIIVQTRQKLSEQSFYQLNPTTFFRIKPGKRALSENTYGPPMTAEQVEKEFKKEEQKQTLLMLADAMDFTLKEARAYMKSQRKILKEAYRVKYGRLPSRARLDQITEHSTWVDLGVYGDRYPVLGRP